MRIRSKGLALLFGTVVGVLVGGTVLAATGHWTVVRLAAWVQERPARDEPPTLEEHLQALGDRLGAPEPSRAFDPSALPREPATAAAEELASLQAALEEACVALDRGARWRAWERSEFLSESLALFPLRFGVAPRDVEGWDALVRTAERTLADLAAEPPRWELSDGDSYAVLFRVLLLDLAGREVEAARRLRDAKGRSFCGNCSQERQGVIERRRSEHAERDGDLEGARARLAGLAGSFFSSGILAPTDPVACTRLGLLDLRLGRAREGATVLQLVVDLAPDAPAAALARAALRQVGALVEPSPERLRALYLDEDLDAPPPAGVKAWRRQAEAALARLEAPPSFEDAARRYREGDALALGQLVAMDDERVLGLLQGILDEGPRRDVVPALRAIAARVDDARAHAAAALQTLSVEPETWVYVEDGQLDALLRGIHGGGPSLRAVDRMRTEELARAWLDWLGREDEGGDG